jgi:predicted DNA binding CopG/RHH family protein
MSLYSSNPSLIHANLFFVDIVGLTDPTMSTKTQIKKIETLNRSITECWSFNSITKDNKLILPTGDGMAIAFLQGPELPLKLAIELHGKLTPYNKGKIPSETLRTRIGIHSGPVFVVEDILNNRNIWGPGIIIARRIMDIGEEGHILLSSRVAEDLRELSDRYKQIIRPLHDYTIKHGQSLLIYSAYGKGFGNSKVPTKASYQKSRMAREVNKLRKKAIYTSIEVNMTIKDPKGMLVHYKRTYEIQNISDTPIHKVVHGVTTDLEKKLDELNLRVYDEHSQPLKISSISVDMPYQKEFTTIFNKPIMRQEKGRYYILEYDIEEPDRYFENAFLVDCQKFIISIDYPKGVDPPVAYELNLENEDQKRRCRIQPTITRTEDNRNIARWVRRDIIQGQSFRFEWLSKKN